MGGVLQGAPLDDNLGVELDVCRDRALDERVEFVLGFDERRLPPIGRRPTTAAAAAAACPAVAWFAGEQRLFFARAPAEGGGAAAAEEEGDAAEQVERLRRYRHGARLDDDAAEGDLEIAVDVLVDDVEGLREARDQQVEEEEHDDDPEEEHQEPCRRRLRHQRLLGFDHAAGLARHHALEEELQPRPKLAEADHLAAPVGTRAERRRGDEEDEEGAAEGVDDHDE